MATEKDESKKAKPAAKAAESRGRRSGRKPAEGRPRPPRRVQGDGRGRDRRPRVPRRGLQAARARQGLLPQALHGLAARRRGRPSSLQDLQQGSLPQAARQGLASAPSTPASRRPRPRRAALPRAAPAACAGTRAPVLVRCRRSSSAAAPACTARCASPAPRTPRCRSWRRRCWRAARLDYRNVPALGDVRTMGRLLARLGAGFDDEGGGIARVDTTDGQRVTRRPTTWSRRCARRCWCSGRWSRATGARACRCRAAARSARARSISTSRGWRRWARASSSSTATSTRARGGCAAPPSCSTWSPSPGPRT